MMATREENTHERRAEQLRDELARKQQFTLMVAHEMRNLLAPLAYGVQLLARDNPAATIRVRPVLGHQIAQMRRLVDDLLDIVCTEQGRMSLRIASIDLREVIAAAIAVAQPAITTQDHHLTLMPDPPPATVVNGDRCRLIQVLSNLLINAAKFTPEGGDIVVRVQHETGCVKVCIRDTGVGIAADILPKIFDIYVRAPRDSDAAPTGLGLGLAVARHLVESHGGTLCAHSAGPGRGSEFVMQLPAGASL
jgi:signal transduction histidine kinase